MYTNKSRYTIKEDPLSMSMPSVVKLGNILSLKLRKVNENVGKLTSLTKFFYLWIMGRLIFNNGFNISCRVKQGN